VILTIATDNLTAAKQQQCSTFCQPRDFDYCYRRFDLFDLTHCDVQLTALYLFGPLSLTVLVVYVQLQTLTSVKLHFFLVFILPCKSFTKGYPQKTSIQHASASKSSVALCWAPALDLVCGQRHTGFAAAYPCSMQDWGMQ